jgi:hypothetical protein
LRFFLAVEVSGLGVPIGHLAAFGVGGYNSLHLNLLVAGAVVVPAATF